MKKTIAALLTVLFFSAVSSAQDIPQIVPPAPEATSIFKFSEVPVSTYTGLPNISIPIYEIKCKELTVPIYLSYHARGIQVAEMAPRVGLGWSLNYGGMISRQIRDKADDEPWGYLLQDYYDGVFVPDSTNFPSMFNAQLSHMYQSYVANGLDMVPDQFMYNANGASGKFIFSQETDDILLQEYKDIRIQKFTEDQKIVGWILTDERGNKFYYGKSKNGTRTAADYDMTIDNFTYSLPGTMAQLGPPQNNLTISAWHLTEIETPFGETISFYYQQEIADYYRHSYDATPTSGSITAISYFSHVHAYQQQLERIEFSSGKLRFSPALQEREDINDAYALDKISIYNHPTLESSSTLAKEYQLSYHYTTSNNDGNQLAYLKTVDPGSQKRLFLSSIQEKGHLGATNPPYTFQYHPVVLPNRFSTSQDAWGYYNGANNGQYLTFTNYGTFNIDRSVDEELSKAGLLTKMVYPTGGSIELTYEQNVAIRPAIMDGLIHSALIRTETEQVLDGFIKNPQYFVGNKYQDTVFIPPTKTSDVVFTIDLPMCPDPIVGAECMYTVRLTGLITGFNNTIYPMPSNERTRTLALAPDTYILSVEGHNSDDSGSLFYVTLEWTETIPDTTYPPGVIPGPGKRVKRIEYKTDSSVFVKEFAYTAPGGATSGVLFGLPPFYSIKDWNGGLPISSPFGCIPGSPLSTYQGNSVGYSRVTEYNGTIENNVGKTEHVFTTIADGGKYYEFPFHPPSDNEWLRGKTISSRVYSRNANGTYQLRKVVENTYDFPLGLGPDDFIHADSADTNGEEPVLVPQSSITRNDYKIPLLVFSMDALYTPQYKVYYQTGGTFNLSSTLERYYHDQELEMLKKLTAYHYDNERHYQVRAVETIASDSSREISVTTYPKDYLKDSLSAPFIEQMKLANLASYPVEQVTYKEQGGDFIILSAKLTKYGDDNPAKIEEVLALDNSEAIPLSSFRFSHRQTGEQPLTGNASSFVPYTGYQKRLTYDRYDSKGNILQYSIEDNVTTSYVWGYYQTRPVAEIKNATYDEVVAVLGQSVIDQLNGAPGTDEQMRSLLAPLYSHPSMEKAQVTVFTYDLMRGVTSITDANGATSHYEYDNMGRLKHVEDKDHNVLKRMHYHYKASE